MALGAEETHTAPHAAQIAVRNPKYDIMITVVVRCHTQRRRPALQVQQQGQALTPAT